MSLPISGRVRAQLLRWLEGLPEAVQTRPSEDVTRLREALRNGGELTPQDAASLLRTYAGLAGNLRPQADPLFVEAGLFAPIETKYVDRVVGLMGDPHWASSSFTLLRHQFQYLRQPRLWNDGHVTKIYENLTHPDQLVRSAALLFLEEHLGDMDLLSSVVYRVGEQLRKMERGWNIVRALLQDYWSFQLNTRRAIDERHSLAWKIANHHCLCLNENRLGEILGILRENHPKKLTEVDLAQLTDFLKFLRDRPELSEFISPGLDETGIEESVADGLERIVGLIQTAEVLFGRYAKETLLARYASGQHSRPLWVNTISEGLFLGVMRGVHESTNGINFVIWKGTPGRPLERLTYFRHDEIVGQVGLRLTKDHGEIVAIERGGAWHEAQHLNQQLAIEKALILVAVKWLHSMGLKVWGLPAERSGWIKKADIKNPEQIYDKRFRQLGMKKDNGWYKEGAQKLDEESFLMADGKGNVEEKRAVVESVAQALEKATLMVPNKTSIEPVRNPFEGLFAQSREKATLARGGEQGYIVIPSEEDFQKFRGAIRRLVKKFEGDLDKTSVALAYRALSLNGIPQVQMITTAYVLGFGRAGLEFLLADVGESIVTRDMKALQHLLAHPDDLAKTHSWMYMGGASTGATVDAVLRAHPQLAQGMSGPLLNHLVKPWLGLVVGSVLSEYAKTGRVNWGAQAKTAIEFQVAGLALLPLRQIMAQAGLATGPIGVLMAAAFLGAEMALVHQFEKTLAGRERSKLVVEKAHAQDKAGLSQAITQYTMGEGLFGDLVALDQAFHWGGKATMEDAGEWNSKTLLGRYLKQLGVEREGRQSVTIHFASSDKQRRKERMERYLEGLLVIREALKNRHADMSISQLRYEMESFEVEKRIALTKMELEAPDSLEVATLLFSKKEEALQQRLFAVHRDWLEKYAKRDRLIGWDGVHLARLDNFAQAVQKSLPQNPEQQHLLGLYLLHLKNNQKQDKANPKENLPHSSPPFVASVF